MRGRQRRALTDDVHCAVMVVRYAHVTYSASATVSFCSLTSTSPLFVIPVARVAYGQKITPVAVLGAAIAFCGVYALLQS